MSANDVHSLLREPLRAAVATLDWIETHGKTPLRDDGYARIETDVQTVRRLWAALNAETDQ